MSQSARCGFRIGDQRRPAERITPPPGTPWTGGETFRIEFSEAMSEVSARSEGIVLSDSVQRSLPNGVWSADGRVVTMAIPRSNYSGSEYKVTHASLHLSRKMTDLAGNPVTPATYVWPAGELAVAAVQTYIVRSWPPDAQERSLRGRNPIALLLAVPVAASEVNRDLWCISQARGRLAGTWTIDGRVAQFQPEENWPLADTISLFSVGSIQLPYGFSRMTELPAPASNLPRIVRTSLDDRNSIPVNGVIDVEFDRDVPSRSVEILLRPAGSFARPSVVAPLETRLRGNLYRYPLGTIYLQTGGAITFRLKDPSANPNVNLREWPLVAAHVDPVRVDAVFPADGDRQIARNARMGLVMSGEVNNYSAWSSIKMTANGATVPFRTSFAAAGISVVPEVPLPANALIRVSLSEWDDVAGRRLAPQSWTFRPARRSTNRRRCCWRRPEIAGATRPRR